MSLTVDLDLVQKYNVAGPRYTSYPPATKFTRSVTWPELEACVRQNNLEERDLSLYVHIPFCESLCWYCGCTTIISRDHHRVPAYIGYLESEIARMRPLMNSRRQV